MRYLAPFTNQNAISARPVIAFTELATDMQQLYHSIFSGHYLAYYENSFVDVRKLHAANRRTAETVRSAIIRLFDVDRNKLPVILAKIISIGVS